MATHDLEIEDAHQTGGTFWRDRFGRRFRWEFTYTIEVSAQCLFNFDADELGPGVNYAGTCRCGLWERSICSGELHVSAGETRFP